jgi:hypothetical protein
MAAPGNEAWKVVEEIGVKEEALGFFFFFPSLPIQTDCSENLLGGVAILTIRTKTHLFLFLRASTRQRILWVKK